MSILDHCIKEIAQTEPFVYEGKVKEVIGNLIRAHNIGLKIGSLCKIITPEDGATLAEVVGFSGEDIFIIPLGELQGLGPNSRIRAVLGQASLLVSDKLLGRVFDANLQPLDGQPGIESAVSWPIYNRAPQPMDRKRITDPLATGIRAIDGLLTVGKGQRVAILAGSGVGKSVLLGMMARYTKAEVNVIGLIGERGREIREFVERDLGKEGLKRSVVIAATSDQSPLVRIRAAHSATAIAEYFREQGKDVLLLVDSLTRFAMAQREIGLSIGEPPTTKGYPPSVFTQFPKLLERAGNSKAQGSITAFYTVLIEGDDPNDPIGDAVRSIVDGHIILDRAIAAKGQYPAIDVLNSKSRLMSDLVSADYWQDSLRFVQTLSTYKDAEDLINIGAYVKGSSAKIDYALNKIEAFNRFLKQNLAEQSNLTQSQQQLRSLVQDHKL